MARHLCQDVGGGAKAVQADTAGRFHQPIGAVAYQSRAEQRRRLQVVVVRRQLEAIAGIGDGELRKTAVNLVAGIAGAVAQVFPPVLAIPAVSTAAAQPGHAHALTRDETADAGAQRLDLTHDLVAWDQRQRRFSQFAVHHMQVGAADAAGGDSQQQLARPGLRCWQLLQLQGLARPSQYHRAHPMPPVRCRLSGRKFPESGCVRRACCCPPPASRAHDGCWCG